MCLLATGVTLYTNSWVRPCLNSWGEFVVQRATFNVTSQDQWSMLTSGLIGHVTRSADPLLHQIQSVCACCTRLLRSSALTFSLLYPVVVVSGIQDALPTAGNPQTFVAKRLNS